MATIFDRETLLDLTVNVIPLGIILFFVAVFVVVDPFPGLDRLGMLLMLGLHIVPFVALAILTYVSGKAIAGDEKRSSVFFQGQATMDNAPTREEARSSFDRHVTEEERETEPAEESVEDDESAAAEQEEEPAHAETEPPEEREPTDATEATEEDDDGVIAEPDESDEADESDESDRGDRSDDESRAQ